MFRIESTKLVNNYNSKIHQNFCLLIFPMFKFPRKIPRNTFQEKTFKNRNYGKLEKSHACQKVQCRYQERLGNRRIRQPGAYFYMQLLNIYFLCLFLNACQKVKVIQMMISQELIPEERCSTEQFGKSTRKIIVLFFVISLNTVLMSLMAVSLQFY